MKRIYTRLIALALGGVMAYLYTPPMLLFPFEQSGSYWLVFVLWTILFFVAAIIPMRQLRRDPIDMGLFIQISIALIVVTGLAYVLSPPQRVVPVPFDNNYWAIKVRTSNDAIDNFGMYLLWMIIFGCVSTIALVIFRKRYQPAPSGLIASTKSVRSKRIDVDLFLVIPPPEPEICKMPNYELVLGKCSVCGSSADVITCNISDIDRQDAHLSSRAWSSLREKPQTLAAACRHCGNTYHFVCVESRHFPGGTEFCCPECLANPPLSPAINDPNSFENMVKRSTQAKPMIGWQISTEDADLDCERKKLVDAGECCWGVAITPIRASVLASGSVSCPSCHKPFPYCVEISPDVLGYHDEKIKCPGCSGGFHSRISAIRETSKLLLMFHSAKPVTGHASPILELAFVYALGFDHEPSNEEISALWPKDPDTHARGENWTRVAKGTVSRSRTEDETLSIVKQCVQSKKAIDRDGNVIIPTRVTTDTIDDMLLVKFWIDSKKSTSPGMSEAPQPSITVDTIHECIYV